MRKPALARWGALALLVLLPCRAGGADAVPRLVRDVDPTSYAASSSPRQLVGLRKGYAFTAFQNRKLVIYDSDDDEYGVALDREEIRQVYYDLYAARDKAGVWTLWRAAGFPYYTAQKASRRTVRRLGPAYPFSDGEESGIFEADDGRGRAVWITGGDDGWQPIARPLPLSDGRLLRDLTLRIKQREAKGYFVARHPALGAALWVTRGTPATTFPVWAPVPGRNAPLRLVGVLQDYRLNRLLLTVSGGAPELWVSDGTQRGTRPLPAIGNGAGGAAVLDAVTAGRRAFLVIDDGRHGPQLWTSDGTAAGTKRLTRFTSRDPFRGAPLVPALAGRDLLFYADDGVHGRELWASDGTAAGTRLVADRCPGPCGTAGTVLSALPTVQNRVRPVLLTAAVPDRGGPADAGTELWASDGTAGGTVFLQDLCAGPCDGSPRDLVPTFFPDLHTDFDMTLTAGTADGKRALWRTDGTPEGTVRLTPPGVAATTGLIDGGFGAADAEFGDELWGTDGTPENTRLILDAGRELDSGSHPDLLGSAGSTLLFTGFDPGHGRRLWASDGSAAGTVPVPGLPPQLGVFDGAAAGSRFFFRAVDGSAPSVWATDGTAAVRLTPPGVTPYFFAGAVGGREIFLAADAEHGAELWVSAGTAASTHLLADLVPGPDGIPLSYPEPLPLLHGRLAFPGPDGIIWWTDGTAEGTGRLADAYPFLAPLQAVTALQAAEAGGKLYFTVTGDDGAVHLWVSDWTATGTHPLAVPQGLPEPLTALQLLPLGGRLLLFGAAGDSYDPRALTIWSSDGTPEGTVPLPGTIDSSTIRFSSVFFGGRLLFRDEDGFAWSTDGTVAGTFPLRDAAGRQVLLEKGAALPGHALFSEFLGALTPCHVWDGLSATVSDLPGLQCEGSFLTLGSRLYFSAFEPHTGVEPWVLEEKTLEEK